MLKSFNSTAALLEVSRSILRLSSSGSSPSQFVLFLQTLMMYTDVSYWHTTAKDRNTWLYVMIVRSHLVLVILVRHRCSPAQVTRDAARFKTISEPRACNVPRVCRPVAGACRLIEPLLQLLLQLHTHTHTHTETQTHTQRHRDTHTHTERHTQTHAHRHTHTHTHTQRHTHTETHTQTHTHTHTDTHLFL